MTSKEFNYQINPTMLRTDKYFKTALFCLSMTALVDKASLMKVCLKELGKEEL